jgi:small subunit ribosomal protein S17
MDKTVLIKIDRQIRHPLYRKIVRRSSRLAAHDEANDAHVGDTVRVVETRPLSKTKRWRVVEIVERAK